MYKRLDEAIDFIQPGQNLFIQTGAAAPQTLIQGLMKKAASLNNMTIYQMHTEGNAPYGDPEWKDIFKVNCFFYWFQSQKSGSGEKSRIYSAFSE